MGACEVLHNMLLTVDRESQCAWCIECVAFWGDATEDMVNTLDSGKGM